MSNKNRKRLIKDARKIEIKPKHIPTRLSNFKQDKPTVMAISLMNRIHTQPSKGKSVYSTEGRNIVNMYDYRNEFLLNVMADINKAPLTSTIIETLISLTYGKGLNYKLEEKNSAFGKVLRKLKGSTDTKTNDFMMNGKYERDNINDVLAKATKDLIIANSFAIKVKWGEDGKYIVSYKHVDISTVRPFSKKPGEDYVKFYGVKNWTTDFDNKYDAPEQIYRTFDEHIHDGGEEQIYVDIEYSMGGNDYFSQLSYIAALSYIQIEGLIAEYQKDTVQNGFTPPAVITLYEDLLSDEELNEFTRRLKSNFSGVDREKIIVACSENKDKKIDIDIVEAKELDKKFISLNEAIMKNVLSAFGVKSPQLVGISTAGKLGGSNEYVEAYESYYNDKVLPLQRRLLKIFNIFGRINNLKPFHIERSTPIQFRFSEQILSQIMHINELRAEVGLDPIEGGDLFVGEIKGVDNKDNVTPADTSETVDVNKNKEK